MKRRLRSLFQGRERQQQRALQLIRGSGLFDVEWHVRTYADAERGGTDPILYWLETGWQLGHDPHPEFSVSRYLHENADVAGAGINPLLHFIEFGRDEGRHAIAPELTWDKPDPATFDFAEPAPVFRGRVADLPNTRWRDEESTIEAPPDTFERILRAIPDQQLRQSLENAVDQLRAFSDHRTETVGTYTQSGGECGALIDAWYANSSRLRTRWSGPEQAAIVRAYQTDPLDGMAIKLIGQALVVSALDIVDLSLANPLFPILLVWLEPAGSARGWSFLVFPSLCRGGLHYPETLASKRDAMAESAFRAGELMALLQDPSIALVESVAVNLRRGDGSGPLFHPYCRLWLEKIMRVQVNADPDSRSDPVTDFLAGGVSVNGSRKCDQSRVLHIGADMMPTIAVLTKIAHGRGNGDNFHHLPLVCSAENSSPNVILLRPPADFAPPHQFLRDAAPWDWPTLIGALGGVATKDCVAAIRYVRQPPISETQWLVPWADPALPLAKQASVTWLMEPSEWRPERIRESLQVLSAQINASSIEIGLIGPVDASVRSIAEDLFPTRVRRYSSVPDAAATASTTMVGFLGRNVILHEPRATFFLAWIADQMRAATASCVMLSQEKVGRQWQSAPYDGGLLTASGNSSHAYTRTIEALWRCSYRVVSPPEDLWLGRARDVADWLRAGNAGRKARRHWCTALITAARVDADGETSSKCDSPAPSNDDQVASYEALV